MQLGNKREARGRHRKYHHRVEGKKTARKGKSKGMNLKKTSCKMGWQRTRRRWGKEGREQHRRNGKILGEWWSGVMGRHKQGGEMKWKWSKGKCGMAVVVLICFCYSCRAMANVCIKTSMPGDVRLCRWQLLAGALLVQRCGLRDAGPFPQPPWAKRGEKHQEVDDGKVWAKTHWSDNPLVPWTFSPLLVTCPTAPESWTE